VNVGIAQIDYTPEIGLPIAGNFRDDYAARGVHDPLRAKAVVFSDTRGCKAALLAVDSLRLTRDNVAMMRRFIASQTDLSGEEVLIHATHTHSAPATAAGLGVPDVDREVVEAFLRTAAGAVVRAAEDLQPARLAVGTSREDRLSFTRRLRCKDGRTHMNWEALEPGFVVEALGAVDPQVTALSVERSDGRQAVAVNFALHPAILAGDNWLYSADYPGCLAEAVGRILGEGCTTLFLNGCCGNVNHIDYRDRLQGRGFKMAQRVGYMLAAAACEALRNAAPVNADRLAVSRTLVPLDRAKVSSEQLAWSRRILEKARAEPCRGQVDGLPDEYYARALLALHRKQDTPDAAEVMAVRIGEVAVVGLPGEAFCEFGLRIKRHSSAGHTIVIEQANDALGYLPTPEAFEQGGYEPTPGSTRYTRDAGERLAEAAIDLLKPLFDD